MIKTLTLAFVYLVLLAACTSNNSDSAVKDMGQTKAGVDAVAVYLPKLSNDGWMMVHDRVVDSTSTVFTVNDKSGKPITWPVRIHGQKATGLKLVEVVFRAANAATWFRGYVLQDCFNWDATKNVDQGVAATAQPARSVQASQVTAGKQICHI